MTPLMGAATADAAAASINFKGGSFSWGDFTEGETLITPLRHVTSHGRGCRYALEVAATRKRRQTLDSVFTALRVCTARTMPWQDVCPSVRLSVCPPVTRRYCV